MNGAPVNPSLPLHRVFISIGSNIEPVRNVIKASAALESALDDFNASPVYRSKAVGMEGPDFLNLVVSGLTPLTVTECHQWLGQLETAQGRIRSAERFSSRTLDLDLLLYDDLLYDTNGLVLPRPEITEVAFVLQPLADLVPTQLHPGSSESYRALLELFYSQYPDQRASLTQVSLSESDDSD